MNYVILYIIIIIVLFIGLLLYKYNPKEPFKNKNTSDIGFIITRHVNTESVNKVWISCVQQIRKSYPNNKIVIIDDNSNYDFIKVPSDNFLNNCIVIDSEYKKGGKIIGYSSLVATELDKEPILLETDELNVLVVVAKLELKEPILEDTDELNVFVVVSTLELKFPILDDIDELNVE